MAVSNYTLADLQQLALDRVEDNSLFYTTDEITPIINEAIRITNLFTGFYQTTVGVLSVADQLVYSTPAGILYPQRIQFEGTQLDPININQIGQEYRTWATDSTSKLGAVARWIPIGISYYCLHPIDALGGQDIEVTGVSEPALLVNDDDTMALEDQYVNIVVEYCAHRLPLKEGGKPTADALRLYTGFLRTMKSLTNIQHIQFPRFFVAQGAPVVEDKK